MTCGYENPAHSGEKQIPLSKDAGQNTANFDFANIAPQKKM
jgi:hypothetical protein